MEITIVGAGTAGLVTALILKQKFNQNDILEHLLLRCDNFKNIVKKIKKKMINL